MTWTNVVHASTSGNDLTKTGTASAWNAGAVSVETLPADGYVEFTTAEATTTKTAGLSNGDAGQNYSDIDFAIRLRANGTVGIYEAGVLVGSFGAYVAGDRFRVQVKNGIVTYHRNGALVYTSAGVPTFPLLVDTSLYTPGATLTDVELVALGLTWQNVVGVSVIGDDLTKTATTNTWTAGASTVQTISGDGFMELVAGETTTSRAAGLSNGDANQGYEDIDFSIRLGPNGTAKVFEGGVLVRNAGAYVPGDRFRVEVSGGSILYSKNGARPFYTSTASPTFPLRVDTSFLTPGGTIKDVTLVAAPDACPMYDGTGQVCVGSFVITNAFDVAQIADCAEITGNVTVQAPGMVELALPKLERVGGTIAIGVDPGDNPDLRRLRLPALKQATDLYLRFYTVQPLAVDLSRLRTVGNVLQSIATGFELSTPCLDSTTEFSATTAASAPSDAYVPRLREVTDLLFGLMTAPALETAGNIDGALDAPVLSTVPGDVSGELVAPVLASIGGDVDASVLSTPMLTEIGGSLSGFAGQLLPALERAGELTIHDDMNLPALAEVTGLVKVGCTTGITTVTSVALPSLQRAGSLLLCWPLQQLDLPQLAVVTGAPPGGYAIEVTSNVGTSFDAPALTTIERHGVSVQVPSSFPVLTAIPGALRTGAPMDAPALTSVAGNANLYGSLTAPQLSQFGGDLVLNAGTLSAPALVSVTSMFKVNGGSFSLPSLAQTGELVATGGPATFELAALTSTGRFTVIGADTITSVSMPVLATTGDFKIQLNSQLTSIDFPALTSVGSLFRIKSNSQLPNCYATNLRDQLLAAGWTGSVEISNNGSGSCF